MPKLHFTFRPNGPLRLEVNPKEETFENILFDENNQSIPMKGSFFFCRCGRSQKQPGCDGSHKRNGFSEAKEIQEDTLQHYSSEDIAITFNRSICSGAAQCVEKFPHIYSSSSSTNWIFPDKGTLEEVIQSVKNCPSGALSYTYKGKGEIETYDEPSLHIIKKGPLHIKGNVTLEGITFSTNSNEQKYSLCRCGASKNKPFCDYSHASIKESNYTF